MKIKRSLSVVLILAFFFAFLPHAGAYSDTEGHPAQQAIERFSEYGIILGYDGLFRPDDSITRAEMAIIIDRMVSYTQTAQNTYQDLDDGWHAEAVLKLCAAGILQGYDGRVRPFDNITRAEAVVMLARTFGVSEYAEGIRIFDDAASIPDWAAGLTGAMAYAGALPFGRNFEYAREITRAEVVQILDALLADICDVPGLYTRNVHGNLLVTAPDVVLTDITVSGNIYVTGQAQNFTFSDAAVLGEVYTLANPDIKADDDSFAGSLSPSDTAPTADIASELDLSHTGTETVSVIVRAGRSLAQIFDLLEEKGVCSAAALFAACETIDFSRYYPFLADSCQAENRIFALEGYIAPDSYTFYTGSSPALVLKTMLDPSAEAYSDYAERAAGLGRTLDEIITIASIIEKEVGGCTEQDRATVASIIYNRLDSGTKLQMNVTENYLETYVLPYTNAALADCEPYYNTYMCSGLPAGAICSPRADCIEAALSPYDTDYIFFRSDRYGNIYYAVTYEEHVQNGTLAAAATEYLGYLGNVSLPEAEDEYVPVDGRYSGVTMLLDPGHGGRDTGAYTGDVSEKDLNLAVALKLRDLLRAEGVNVLLTRDDDTTLTPYDRVDLANDFSPDLFLSIHCNSYEDDHTVNGIETYYYPGDAASAEWANYLQNAMIAASAAADRGVRSNELIVLHYTQMPSVMVELGFLTNDMESNLLQSEMYQSLLAQALADATFAYLDSRTA